MANYGKNIMTELANAGLGELCYLDLIADQIICSRQLTQVEQDKMNTVIAEHIPNAATVTDVKAEAAFRILSVFPEWKQRNMNMCANELNDKRVSGETLTTAEETEAQALRGIAVWIKSVRDASDTIEADLGTMTVTQMKSDVRWPDPI